MITGTFMLKTELDERTPIACLEAHMSILEMPKDIKLMTHDTGEEKCRCWITKIRESSDE